MGANDDGWFYYRQTLTGDHKEGPITFEALTRLLADGIIKTETPVASKATQGRWVRADSIPRLVQVATDIKAAAAALKTQQRQEKAEAKAVAKAARIATKRAKAETKLTASARPPVTEALPAAPSGDTSPHTSGSVAQQNVTILFNDTGNRSVVVAVLLNIFCIVGLGQFYQGRLLAGMFWFFATATSTLLTFVFGIGFVLLPIVYVLCILEAAVHGASAGPAVAFRSYLANGKISVYPLVAVVLVSASLGAVVGGLTVWMSLGNDGNDNPQAEKPLAVLREAFTFKQQGSLAVGEAHTVDGHKVTIVSIEKRHIYITEGVVFTETKRSDHEHIVLTVTLENVTEGKVYDDVAVRARLYDEFDNVCEEATRWKNTMDDRVEDNILRAYDSSGESRPGTRMTWQFAAPPRIKKAQKYYWRLNLNKGWTSNWDIEVPFAVGGLTSK